MKRRSFLKYSSLFSAPLLLGGFPVSSVARNVFSGLINEETDRVLVLIQLNGGNDGLNTLIPLDQYDTLANLRSNILLPENSLLALDDKLAFHGTMGGVKSLYDDGKIKIIQSVGYPQQNRSHFRSLDIWHSGSAADQYLNTGWLGRFLDMQFPGYPEAYPNETYKDPFAVTVGSVVSETCQGLASNFSMTLVDPENLSQLNSPVNNNVVDGCTASQLDFLINAIEQTNEYGDRIQEAYASGNNLSSQYPDGNRLAAQLKTVARLISGGLKSRIYVVSLGGFDTHAEQVQAGASQSGQHADLLQTLSDAISAFQNDIMLLGKQDQVLGMTYSEFGRRIRSNFSLGTDHGDAAPLIIFGNCVNPGVAGENPYIDPQVSQNDAVPMQFDFRSVYGSVLMDWFGADEETVRSLFNHDFQYLPIATQCSSSTSVSDLQPIVRQLKIFPNPAHSNFTLEVEGDGAVAKILIFNQLGQKVQHYGNLKVESGINQIPINMEGFAAGTYFIRYVNGKIISEGRIVLVN